MTWAELVALFGRFLDALASRPTVRIDNSDAWWEIWGPTIIGTLVAVLIAGWLQLLIGRQLIAHEDQKETEREMARESRERAAVATALLDQASTRGNQELVMQLRMAAGSRETSRA